MVYKEREEKEKINEVLFDWSGTLSDDFGFVFGAAAIMFQKLNLGELTEKMFRQEFEMPYMRFWARYAPSLRKNDADKMYHEIVYGNNTLPKPKSFDGVKEMLECLNDLKKTLFIVSSHPHEKLKQEIEDYGWSKYFKDIMGGCHIKSHGLIEMLARHKIKPNQAIYAGDMVHDIESANICGVASAAVCNGYDSKEKLLNAKPNLVLSQIIDLPKFLS